MKKDKLIKLEKDTMMVAQIFLRLRNEPLLDEDEILTISIS